MDEPVQVWIDRSVVEQIRLLVQDIQFPVGQWDEDTLLAAQDVIRRCRGNAAQIAALLPEDNKHYGHN